MEFLDKIEFVLREGFNNFTDFLSRYSCTLTVFFLLLVSVFCIVFFVLWLRGDL